MTLNEDDLRTLWRERSADVPTDRSTCLSEMEWARLLSKDADGTERLRAAGHIASCAACADEYRLLQPLKTWAADVERVLLPPAADRDAHRIGWRIWWSPPRLGLAVGAAASLLVAQGFVVSQLVASWRANSALETQLAENTGALSATQSSLAALQEELRGQTAAQTQLQQRLAQLSSPQLDVAIVDLEPQHTVAVRGGPDSQIVSTAPTAPAVTLILNFSPLASRSTLEIEVADEGGPVRWVGRTQRDTGTANVTLVLPSADYPAATYVIRLFDVTRGRTLLATYPVAIRHLAEKGR